MAVPNSVFRSSTAPNAVNSSADLLTFKGGNRKSSSETRTSSSPDDANITSFTSRRRRDNRPSSRGKRRSHPNGLLPIDKSADTEFPSVLDENITGTRLQLPVQNVNVKGRSTGRLAVLKPLNSNEQLSGLVQPQSTHRHPNPLSISGLAKPDSSPEESADSNWTQTTNSKTASPTRQPVSVNQTSNNNNNCATSATSSSSQSTEAVKSDSSGPVTGLAVTATGTTTYSVARKPNKQSASNQVNSTNNAKPSLRRTGQTNEPDAKYADPIAGASASFQARLAELASLEAETVRYERLRRLKKKNKERDD